MRHSLKRLLHSTKDEPSSEPSDELERRSSGAGEKMEALSVLQDEEVERDLWQRALKTVQRESKSNFLNDLHPGDRSTLGWVSEIREQASERARDTRNHERGFQLPGGKTCTYLQIYENVATYASKFEVVGGLMVQGEPGYATIPWVCLSEPSNCHICPAHLGLDDHSFWDSSKFYQSSTSSLGFLL